MNYIFNSIKRMAALSCAAVFAAGAFAVPQPTESDTQFGELQMDTEYQVPSDYKRAYGHIVATSTGTMLLESSAGLQLFSDSEMTVELYGDYKGYNVPYQCYEYEVEEGHTYYVYSSFNQGGSFHFTMGATELTLVGAEPAAGEVYSHTLAEEAVLHFSAPVSAGSAVISAGSQTRTVPTSTFGSYLYVPLKGIVEGWYNQNLLAAGDDINIKVSDVMATTGGALYNGDGIFEITYKAAGKSTRKISEKVPNPFLSYFIPGDVAGVLEVEFDKEILADGAFASLNFGNPENDGEYYYEELPVTVEGSVVKVDFTGKSRRPSELIGLATAPDLYTIQLHHVKDIDGNFVESNFSGMIGSFAWSVPYQEVPVTNVYTEFAPASGGSLQGINTLEVYINGLQGIRFDGFRFAFTDAAGEAQTVDVPVADCQVEYEGSGEGTYQVPVPAAVQGGKAITVTLYNLISVDGRDHSSDVKAVYDTFVITYANPRDGSSLEMLEPGSFVTVRTNYTAANPEMVVYYEILDASTENLVVKERKEMTRGETGEFTDEIEKKVSLTRGHDYQVRFTAYETPESETILGEASIYWKGEGAPFETSDYLLTSVDPADGSRLNAEDTVVTLTFDGLVTVKDLEIACGDSKGEFKEIVPVDGVDPDDDDEVLYFSNTWKLTVSGEWLGSVNGDITLTFRPYDMDLVLLVPENTANPNEETIHTISYTIENVGVSEIEANESGKFEIFCIDGRTLGEYDALPVLPAGLYIINGRKHLVK